MSSRGEDNLGQGMAVQLGRVLAAHRAELGGGVASRVFDHGLRVRPGGVTVRVVDLDHDVVETNAMTCVDGRTVFERAEPERALEDVARVLVPPDDVGRMVDDVVEPVERHRYPTD